MPTLEIYQDPDDSNVNFIEYQGKIYPFYSSIKINDKIENHLNGEESITTWVGFSKSI